MILQFTCPCGHVFRCAKAAPGESRGVCAACREPISEAMEAAAVPAMSANPSRWNCMSDAEELKRLEADNARLRALIKASLDDVDWCPWCKRDATPEIEHTRDCPTFTPSGEVR